MNSRIPDFVGKHICTLCSFYPFNWSIFFSASSPRLNSKQLFHSHGTILIRICATINSSMYFGGVIVVSWLTFGTLHWDQSISASENNTSAYSGDQWAWRLPILLQALGPTILLCFTSASLLPGPLLSLLHNSKGTQTRVRPRSAFAVPESPRWLVAHGYIHEAHSVLAQAHANGDMQDELVLGELGEIQDCLVKEREEAVGKGMWEGWKDLWRTEGLRRRMLVVTIIGAGSQLKGSEWYLSPFLFKRIRV